MVARRAPVRRRNPAKPRVLWHATDKAFDRFDPDRSGLGTHFGTYRAASHRKAQASKSGARASDPKTWRVTKYRVALANPLRLRDAGAWDSEADVEAAMLAGGVMTRADYAESRRHSGAPFWRWARAKIEAAGYDAVVYRNTLEDRGHDSFVVWRDDQIEYAPAPVANPSRTRPARRRTPRRISR